MSWSLGKVGIDGVGDHRPVFAIQRVTVCHQQLADPFGQEGTVGRGVWQSQGIEPGRLTR